MLLGAETLLESDVVMRYRNHLESQSCPGHYQCDLPRCGLAYEAADAGLVTRAFWHPSREGTEEARSALGKLARQRDTCSAVSNAGAQGQADRAIIAVVGLWSATSRVELR
jgi:hypothetical protein